MRSETSFNLLNCSHAVMQSCTENYKSQHSARKLDMQGISEEVFCLWLVGFAADDTAAVIG